MPNHGVAVTIPEPWATTLQSAREAVGDAMASAIPPHVTLLPPTAILEPELPAFLDHLRAVTQGVAPFEIVLSGTGTFRPVSPVVFVQVSRGIGECEELELAVRSGPVERLLDFPYHPHVTIAHHLPDEALDRAFDELSGFESVFDASEFHLYVHDDQDGWQPTRDFMLRPAGKA